MKRSVCVSLLLLCCTLTACAEASDGQPLKESSAALPEKHITDEGYAAPTLTAQKDHPSARVRSIYEPMPLIAETADGIYYRTDEYDGSGQTLYQFCDRSGTAVPLCARANCLHDGSAFCEASADTYRRTWLLSADGTLYSFADKKNGNFDFSFPVLLSYAPDGTGIEELAYWEMPYTAAGVTDFCVHRGCLYALVSILDDPDFQDNTIVGSQADCSRRGYAVIGYDPRERRQFVVCEEMPPAGKPGRLTEPTTLWGSGDDLYFWQPKQPRSGDGIHRVSLLTGEAETYLSGNIPAIAPSAERFIRIDASAGNPRMLLRDPGTDTDTLLDMQAAGDVSWEHMLFDGVYLYTESAENSVLLLSTDMQICGSIAIPEDMQLLHMFSDGETLTVILRKRTADPMQGIDPLRDGLKCSVSDLIAGKAEWLPLYK